MIPLTTVLSGGDRVKEMAVLLTTSCSMVAGGPSGTEIVETQKYLSFFASADYS